MPRLGAGVADAEGPPSLTEGPLELGAALREHPAQSRAGPGVEGDEAASQEVGRRLRRVRGQAPREPVRTSGIASGDLPDFAHPPLGCRCRSELNRRREVKKDPLSVMRLSKCRSRIVDLGQGEASPLSELGWRLLTTGCSGQGEWSIFGGALSTVDGRGDMRRYTDS
jgi:hypothetical protein